MAPETPMAPQEQEASTEEFQAALRDMPTYVDIKADDLHALYQLWGSTPWLAAGLGVSGATVGLLLTKTLHPPGGATALLAVIGGPKIHALGYLYVVVPAGAGACLLLSVALFVNNLAGHRRYPEYRW